jgi:hypothetical protein
MARSYKRDKNGRFSGTGGGGGGGGGTSKAASTRKANTARAAELKAKGTTGLGDRLKAKGFSGGKGAQERAGGLRSSATASGRGVAFTVGKGGKMSGGQAAATSGAIKAAATAKSKAGNAGKAPARTDKAPASAAKARYKQLSGAARKSSPFRSAADNRKAAGAKRSLKSMIAKRGRG